MTLLALLIAFTFSMAVSRYDQRKTVEEAEANAIGTEYQHAALLPATEAAHVRDLLIKYLDQRVAFYETLDESELSQTGVQIAKLQAELWSVVSSVAKSQPTPIAALTVAGMNYVLNSQGYTQAAWWDRIPVAVDAGDIHGGRQATCCSDTESTARATCCWSSRPSWCRSHSFLFPISIILATAPFGSCRKI